MCTKQIIPLVRFLHATVGMTERIYSHARLQGSRLEFFTSIHYGYQHFKLDIQVQKLVSKYI